MNSTHRSRLGRRCRRSYGVGVTAALLLASALMVSPIPRSTAALAASNDPVVWGEGCSSSRLRLDNVDVKIAPALTENPDTNPDGTPVRIAPDQRGRYAPVIMVHGWIGRDTHHNGRDGAFSHRIDLTANRLGEVTTTRSLIGQLQRIPGVAVYTFDYRDYAARWVDDKHLGPALGKVIDCLYKASGEKVIVVGHSMGGLVARYAATHPGVTGADRAGEISQVITFGTPQTGSIPASAVDATAGNASAVLRLLLATCGQLASVHKVDTGTVCDTLPAPARTFYSEAGVALRAGSAQLAALAPFPKSIRVTALAGGATLHLNNPGWFALPWRTTAVNVGDLIVTTGSALHRAAQTRKTSCAYQLNAVRGTTDQLGLWFGLTSKADVAQQPLASFAGACFHTNLMRDIELTNEATAAVGDELRRRNRPPRVRLTATSVADIGFGTAGPAAEAALTRRLGKPDKTFNGGCEISGMKGRWLQWGSLTAVLTGTTDDTQTLTTWIVRSSTSPRFRLDLPYGLGPGTPMPTVLKAVPGATGSWDSTFGWFSTYDDRDQIQWLSDQPSGRGPVTQVSSGGEALLCD